MFSICLKDLFAFRSFETGIFMSLQAVMVRIVGQKSYGFLDCFVTFL